MSGSTLIGRQRELAGIAGSLAEARTGYGAILLLSGEAGAGKTTLLDQAATLAQTAGMAVAWSTTPHTEGAPPFWPWVEVLRALPDSEPQRPLAAALAALTEPVTHGDAPEAARFRLFDQVAQALTAHDSGALIVLDDLHRADGGTLRLLEFLAPRLRRSHLVLAVATRPLVDDEEVAITTGALVHAGARRIDLQPWTEGEVAAALEARGIVAGAATLRQVCELTRGNPFFVLELAGEAARSGAAISSLRPPPAVVDALRAELRRLPAAALDLLHLAAAWGQDAPVDVLADAAGLSVLEVARLAPAAWLDQETSTLRFRHDLVREAVQAGLRPHDQQRLHARLAAAVAGGRLPPAERERRLAVHGCRAGATWDAAAAFAAATTAAREAAAQLGIETAIAFSALADQARAHLPPDSERDLTFTLAYGELLTTAGRHEQAATVLLDAAGLARAAGDIPALARAALLLGLGTEVAGQQAETAGVLMDEALRGLDREEHALRARLLARKMWQALATSSLDATAERLAREAVAEARVSEDAGAIAYALNACFATMQEPDAAPYRAVAREITVRARQANDSGLVFSGLLWEAHTAFAAGDLPDARECIARFDGHAGRYPLPYHSWYRWVLHAALALVEHRLDDAARAIGQIDPRTTAQPGFAALILATQHMELAIRRGDADGFADAAGRVLAMMEGTWVDPAIRAHIAAIQGDRDDAAIHLARFCAYAGNGARDNDWLSGVIEAGMAACRLGDRGHAAGLLALLEPFAERWDVIANATVCRGPVAGVLAALALLCGDAAGAARYQARARAQTAGTPGALFWMEACLKAVRATAPAPRPIGLSEREAEVLALLAAGLGNQEIADRLVLSVRTVQRHVENIYAKTGARGRAAAAVYATSHGITAPERREGLTR